MKERRIQLNARTISFYILGFSIVGLGINLMLRSNIGAGAWDATNFNLNDLVTAFLPGVTYGMTSLMISSVLFVTVMTYRRWNAKLFFMLVPIITISSFIDFWDLVVFNNFHPEPLLIRSFLFAGGGLLIPFGLALIVSSEFPATVYDEFSIMLMEIMKSDDFGKVRLVFEVSGVVLAIVFSLIAGTGLGAVNIGTVIMAITLGPLMSFYLKLLGGKKHG